MTGSVSDLDPTALHTEWGRAAWLEERRKGIGSSDAAALVGLSKWATPLHVYLEKVGEWNSPETAPKKAGLRLEQVVADWYFDVTGRRPEWPDTAILAHPSYPWMLASLDRKVWTGTATWVLELKTAREDSEWGTPGTDEIPDYYNLQVQHQLAVTGWEVGEVAVLFAGQDFRVYQIPRNEKIISTLIGVEGDFWNRIQRRDPPPPDFEHPRTLELLKNLYGVQSDLEVTLAGDAFQAAQRILRIDEERLHLKKEKQALQGELLDAMGPAGLARLSGGITLTRKRVKRKGYSVEPTEYTDFRIKVKED